MAATATYPAATGPVAIAKRILPADAATIVDLYDNSAGSVAVKVESLVATSTNTVDRLVSLYLYSGITSFLLGTKTVPDLSGTNGATDPVVNLLSIVATSGADGVPVLWIPAGTKLQTSLDAALAANKTMDITGRVYPYT